MMDCETREPNCLTIGPTTTGKLQEIPNLCVARSVQQSEGCFTRTVRLLRRLLVGEPSFAVYQGYTLQEQHVEIRPE